MQVRVNHNEGYQTERDGILQEEGWEFHVLKEKSIDKSKLGKFVRSE